MLHNKPLSEHCYYFLHSVCIFVSVWSCRGEQALRKCWWWNAWLSGQPYTEQWNGCSHTSYYLYSSWSSGLRWWILPSLTTECNIFPPSIWEQTECQRVVTSHLNLILLRCTLFTVPCSGCLVRKSSSLLDKLFWLKLQSVSKVYRKGIWI